MGVSQKEFVSGSEQTLAFNSRRPYWKDYAVEEIKQEVTKIIRLCKSTGKSGVKLTDLKI